MLRAAEELEAATRAASAARLRLAAATAPGDAAIPVPRRWRWARRLLDARGTSLLRIPGVVGVGLGHAIRDGVVTGDPCITVFVRRKLRESTLRERGVQKVPRYVCERGGRRLDVDVVPLGRLDRAARAGESFGPERPPRRGTLGAVGTDLASRARVAITAMHLTGLAEYPPDGPGPGVSFCAPSRHDDPAAPVVGRLLRGTTTDIDAAKVQLEVVGDNFIPGIGPILGWRPVSYPADVGIIVRMHGATSGFEQGYIVNPCVDLPGDRLEDAIVVRIETARGDSGAPLVDPDRLLIGFLVGAGSSGLRVFTPAPLVLARLGCDVPS